MKARKGKEEYNELEAEGEKTKKITRKIEAINEQKSRIEEAIKEEKEITRLVS